MTGRPVTVIGILLCLLTGNTGWGYAKTEPVDSLKEQIATLVKARKYRLAADTYQELGWIYNKRFGWYNKYSIEAFLNGMRYYGLVGDSVGYYNAQIAIGDYYSQDTFMKNAAVKYTKNAMRYFSRAGNMHKVIECRISLANILQNSNAVNAALITDLRRTVQLSKEHKEAYFDAYSQNLLASSYSRLQRPDSAQFYAVSSLVMAKEQKINWLISLNYFYLGLVEQFRGQQPAALDYFQRSFKLSVVDKNIGILRELSRHMATSYALLGDHKKAYDWSLRALTYSNEFYTSEQTKGIQVQELDNQIKSLEVEKKLIQEQNRTQSVVNYMLVAGLVVCVLGVVALVFLRRQQKLIASQQAVIADQQIRKLELKSLRAMIDGQESERSRIARDLHDGLGIQLSRIKLFVEAHQEQLPLSVKEPLNQFLDEACTETRVISNDLRPYALSTFGLVPALEDLVQKLNLVNQTRLELEHYGELPALNDEASVMLYRVIQELLNNGLKHARAETITVQLMANDEAVLVSVDDNGIGGNFADSPPTGTGSGIANVNSRISYLGGQVMWHSEAGKGTSVMISLPLNRLLKQSIE